MAERLRLRFIFAIQLGMEVVVNLLRHFGTNARDFGNLLGGGFPQIVDRAKMREDLFLAVVAQARNVF